MPVNASSGKILLFSFFLENQHCANLYDSMLPAIILINPLETVMGEKIQRIISVFACACLIQVLPACSKTGDQPQSQSNANSPKVSASAAEPQQFKFPEHPSESPAASADREKFLGKWRERGTKVIHEFLSNGTRNTSYATFDTTFDWAILDDQLLRVTATDDNAPTPEQRVVHEHWKYTIDSDDQITLVLKNERLKSKWVTVLIRIKE